MKKIFLVIVICAAGMSPLTSKNIFTAESGIFINDDRSPDPDFPVLGTMPEGGIVIDADYSEDYILIYYNGKFYLLKK